MSYDVERDSRFARAEAVLEEFFGRVDSGEQISFESWTAKHAEIAGELRQLHSVCEPLRARTSGSDQQVAGSMPSVFELDPLLNGPNHFADYEIDPDPIAEGGMGTILSVRDRSLRRALAMKVLRSPSMRPVGRGNVPSDSRRVARFLDEARITSQLDHPGIVPVHEMGLDASGRPYFTMKRVQGQTLEHVLERVAAGDADWPQVRALGVLQRVCEAVAFAHKRGVIHRDLKPANVMVGDFGEVYVMDWGLARVLESDDTASESRVESARRAEAHDVDDGPSLDTQHGDVLGTPAYMAPEQAAGKRDEVGRHSDAYSIGAMLYQLLSGRPPYADAQGMPAPRVVLAHVLEGSPASLQQVARNAPPELIAICERAMTRDWTRRYADVAALSTDLSAFLEGRVVRAYETGAWAEARKWVQRNQLLAASLAATLLILIVGIATTATQYVRANAKAAEALTNLGEATKQRGIAEENATRANKEKEQAQQHAAETQLVADFQAKLLEDLSVDRFGHALVVQLRNEVEEGQRRVAADPEEAARVLSVFDLAVGSANATNVAQRLLAATLFDPAVATIEEEYSEKPLLQATLQSPLARTLRKLGLYESGERVARAALDTRTRILGADHPDTLISESILAWLLIEQGKLSAAEPLCRENLAKRRSTLGDDHADTLVSLNSLSVLLWEQGEFAEAESVCRDALARRRATLGNDHLHTLASIGNLAIVLQVQGKLDEAEPFAREAMEGLRAQLGENHRDTLGSIDGFASLLMARGSLSEAESLFRVAVAGKRATLGDDHHSTLKSINNLGNILQQQGKFKEAEPVLRESLDGFRSKLGADHPDTVRSLTNLGSVLRCQGRLGEAEPLLREGLAKDRSKLGDDHADTLMSIYMLALLLEDQGKLDEAESLLREALAGRRTTLGDHHRETLRALSELGDLLSDRGKLEEAEPLMREALMRLRDSFGDDDANTLATMNNLALTLAARGNLGEAESLCREAWERRHRLLGDDHADTVSSIGNLGMLLAGQGKLSEAEPLLRDAWERDRRILGDDDSSTLTWMAGLGEALQLQGKLGEAEPLLRDASARGRRIWGEQHHNTLRSIASLGQLLIQTGSLAEAEQMLLDCETACVQVGNAVSSVLTATRTSIVELYDAMEKATPGQGYAAKADGYRSALADAERPPR